MQKPSVIFQPEQVDPLTKLLNPEVLAKSINYICFIFTHPIGNNKKNVRVL